MPSKVRQEEPFLPGVHRRGREIIIQTGIEGVQLKFDVRYPERVWVRCWIEGHGERISELETSAILIAGQRMIRAAILHLEAVTSLSASRRPGARPQEHDPTKKENNQ